MQSESRLASVDHFAEITDLSARTIWGLIAAQKIPVLRIGRRTLIPVEDGISALERIAKEAACAASASSPRNGDRANA